MARPTFAEFWPEYVRAHQKTGTQLVHALATMSYLGLLVAALLTRRWWLLLLMPVAAYSLAWFSHFFIERNKPASFHSPWLSLLGDHKMFYLVLTGRMRAEVTRLSTSTRS